MPGIKGDANIVAVDNGNITSDELHIGKTQLEKTIQRHLFHERDSICCENERHFLKDMNRTKCKKGLKEIE